MFSKAAALLTCILVFRILSAFAADFSGPVIGILDGDTIEVLHNNKAERIRLNGIDCPEKGQAYGKRAKLAASDSLLTIVLHD
jgi:endonuclease YncB( thermonuclease family)